MKRTRRRALRAGGIRLSQRDRGMLRATKSSTSSADRMDPTETLFPLATVMDHAGVPSEFLSIGVSMVTVHGPPGASAHARVRASSMRAFAGSAAGIRLSSFTYFIRRTWRPPGVAGCLRRSTAGCVPRLWKLLTTRTLCAKPPCTTEAGDRGLTRWLRCPPASISPANRYFSDGFVSAALLVTASMRATRMAKG
jgi:hypothetical protein